MLLSLENERRGTSFDHRSPGTLEGGKKAAEVREARPWHTLTRNQAERVAGNCQDVAKGPGTWLVSRLVGCKSECTALGGHREVRWMDAVVGLCSFQIGNSLGMGYF